MTQGAWAELFFATTVTLGGCCFGLLVAWLRARERAIRAEARSAAGTDRTAAGEQLLGERFDAMADEVARLSDGQDFLVRTLSDPRPAGARVSDQHRIR